MKNERQKTVLFFTDFAPSKEQKVYSGTERFVFDIAEWMNRKGRFKVELLTPNWNNLPEEENLKGVTIHRFKTHSIYRQNPVLRTYHYLKAAAKLPGYDLYHGCSTLSPIIAAIYSAKRKKGRSVTTIFIRDFIEKNLNALLRPLVYHLIRGTDYITFNFWNIEDYYKRKGAFAGVPMSTIPCWADPHFKPTKEKRKGKRGVLYVGRMIEEKGFYDLLEAFALLEKKRPDVELVLVGIAPDKKKIEAEIERLGIGRAVRLRGFVTEKELAGLYNSVDFVAAPSHYRDGITWSFIEGASCGTPTICSNHYQMPVENIQPVVEPKKPAQLAEEMFKLLSDKKYYDKCRKNALSIGQTLFDKEKIMRKFQEVYEKA